MKTKVIFLLCMIFSIITFGQDKQTELMEVNVTAPKFTGVENISKILYGSDRELIGAYLLENFIYPKKLGIDYVEGTEVVRFTVTPSGNLINFEVINSVAYAIDDEIIRVLQTTDGMWKPGYNNGEPVAMEKEVSLAIKIGETDDFALRKDFLEIAKFYFNKGTKLLLTKEKPKRALRNFDMGVRYLPYDKNLLIIRGLCQYELGNYAEARRDWERVKMLGGVDFENTYFADNTENLKGFAELREMIDEKDNH